MVDDNCDGQLLRYDLRGHAAVVASGFTLLYKQCDIGTMDHFDLNSGTASARHKPHVRA